MKKRWPMYTDIQSLKSKGFSKRQTAARLDMNFRTVAKYWDLSAEEFEQLVVSRERKSKLEDYEGVVINWLRQNPDMSAAQVLDWLKEHYSVKASSSTIRRLVQELRLNYQIPKVAPETLRQYMPVDDPPMGKQMQVDLGKIHIRDASTGNYRQLYCIGCVLSNSRYKWGKWYASPPNAAQFVAALEECFEYMGGMPLELVFDQDRLLAVDENYGDIIYTKEFEAFRAAKKFEVYLCRKADPESKGRVEAVVKYFKKGFANHRIFKELDLWNESFLEWLYRTGNACIHGTTKKIPAEQFKIEKAFLQPVPNTKTSSAPTITRMIHKDNTVFYSGCRYTLPTGTYQPGREVTLNIEDGVLKIYDAIKHVFLTEHPLSDEKGKLVRNSNHYRNYSEPVDEMQSKLFEKMLSLQEAQAFLTQVRCLKSRYARDQFTLIEKTIEEYPPAVWQKALDYCIMNGLYSATEFRESTVYFHGVNNRERLELESNPKIMMFPAIKSEKRSLSEYSNAAKGELKE